MASLDWAHLHPTTRSPLPLPSEKFLLTTSSVSLSLFPCLVGSSPSVAAQPHKEYTVSSGTLHASSKRVVYVADVGAKRTVPAGRGGGAGLDGLGGGGELETLSVPYSHFLDGRFQQPWFGASYYESLCLPSEGGGLSVSLATASERDAREGGSPCVMLLEPCELTMHHRTTGTSLVAIDLQREWRRAVL